MRKKYILFHVKQIDLFPFMNHISYKTGIIKKNTIKTSSAKIFMRNFVAVAKSWRASAQKIMMN